MVEHILRFGTECEVYAILDGDSLAKSCVPIARAGTGPSNGGSFLQGAELVFGNRRKGAGVDKSVDPVVQASMCPRADAGVYIGPLDGRPNRTVEIVLGDVERESVLIVGDSAQLPTADRVIPPCSTIQESLAPAKRQQIGAFQREAVGNIDKRASILRLQVVNILRPGVRASRRTGRLVRAVVIA